MKIGLVGDSYQAYSVSVDGETCMNFYPEIQARDGGKSNIVLYRTPGLVEIANGAGSCRGIYTEPRTGRVFIVNGDQLNEFRFTGGGYSFLNIGTLNVALGPVQFASSGFQLAIVTGNQLYVMDLATDTITLVPGVSPVCISFMAGYFVIAQGGTTFTNSALYDATEWPGDEYTAEQVPDVIINIVNDTRYFWIQGRESTEIWAVTGGVDGVLEPVAGAVMLIGASSRDCTVQLDNTFFFLGEGKNGDRVAYRATGFNAQRISNHAIEAAWAKYQVISDAIAFAYVENGHSFWVISFPYEDKTWVYDVSTTMWHERGYWNQSTARFESIRGRYGCFGLGYQLCADKANGKIYRMSMEYLTDGPDFIRRVRRTPHTFAMGKRIFMGMLEIFAQPGVGLTFGQGEDATIMLRISRDGGQTWGTYREASLGRKGVTKHRTFWTRLGTGRDVVFEISITDPVNVVLIDAELTATAGNN